MIFRSVCILAANRYCHIFYQSSFITNIMPLLTKNWKYIGKCLKNANIKEIQAIGNRHYIGNISEILALFWKCLKCKANISAILILHWEYLKCEINFSEMLVLYQKYFEFKDNIFRKLVLHCKYFYCTSVFFSKLVYHWKYIPWKANISVKFVLPSQCENTQW